MKRGGDTCVEGSPFYAYQLDPPAEVWCWIIISARSGLGALMLRAGEQANFELQAYFSAVVASPWNRGNNVSVMIARCR